MPAYVKWQSRARFSPARQRINGIDLLRAAGDQEESRRQVDCFFICRAFIAEPALSYLLYLCVPVPSTIVV